MRAGRGFDPARVAGDVADTSEVPMTLTDRASPVAGALCKPGRGSPLVETELGSHTMRVPARRCPMRGIA